MSHKNEYGLVSERTERRQRQRLGTDEFKLRYGNKDAQIGLLLHEEEAELLKQVTGHWDMGITDWLTHAIMHFMHLQRSLPPTEAASRLEAMKRWIPPKPALTKKNIRIPSRLPFPSFVGGVPLTHAVRWILRDEAPRTLATMSNEMRMRLRDEAKKEIYKARNQTTFNAVPAWGD
jgi:hypothetical protein